jgi:hypothetical protein
MEPLYSNHHLKVLAIIEGYVALSQIFFSIAVGTKVGGVPLYVPL